jgi:tripartite-type tricarboxylate transporter receptor subunit TctC
MPAAIASPARSDSIIRILVGYPAGGAPDAVARVFADQLRQTTGATVIVENRTGASGKIAIDTLLSASTDGQTVTVIPASAAILVPMVVKAAKYDVIKDFIALGSLIEHGFGVAAGPAAGISDFPGLKTWAEANPTQASFATPGLGTPQHFLGAELEKVIGIDMTHVPYRGGAQAIADVIGGQVPLLITTEQLLVPLQGEGKLKTLFVTSRDRNPKMPTVPTAKEVGLAQLEVQDWFGLFAKAGTPAAKIEEWRAHIDKIIATPAYREAIANMGYKIPEKQLADYTQQLEAQRGAWAERVRLSGFEASE